MDFTKFDGKKVYLRTSSNRHYSGKVIEVSLIGMKDSGFPVYEITIRDKFDCLVTIKDGEIRFIEEQRI